MYTFLNIKSITTFRSPKLIIILLVIATLITTITGVAAYRFLHYSSYAQRSISDPFLESHLKKRKLNSELSD